jgi:anti-anti-sigma regulatory factor
MARAKKTAAIAKAPEPPLVVLGRSCVIGEVAALKLTLLKHLEATDPVTIDPTAVERIDTAALQLLFAFERQRARAGRAVTWRGGSTVLANAVATLGLTLGCESGAPG